MSVCVHVRVYGLCFSKRNLAVSGKTTTTTLVSLRLITGGFVYVPNLQCELRGYVPLLLSRLPWYQFNRKKERDIYLVSAVWSATNNSSTSFVYYWRVGEGFGLLLSKRVARPST